MDVTIRDGSYAINYQWSLGQVAQIAGALDKAGIHYIEVSHGCGLGAAETMGLPAAASDAEYVRSAKSVVKKAKIGVIAGAVTRLKDIDLVIDDIDFIRFATNVNGPRTVEENLNYTKKKRPKLPIFFQLMRSSRLPKSEILGAARTAQEMGAGVVYLVDTAGHFIPQEVEDIVSTLAAKLKIKIGFHGHDNLRMAVANSLAAIRAGATHVDASLRGMGRAGGNAQIEALVSLMKRTGHARNIDLDALTEAAEKFVAPVMPPTAGISQIDLLTADANIDLYPLGFYEAIAEAANFNFIQFMRAIASEKDVVDVGDDAIRRAIIKLKGDPEMVFKTLDSPTRRDLQGEITPRFGDGSTVILALKTPLALKYFSSELLDELEQQFPNITFHFVNYDRAKIEHIEDADILFAIDITSEVLASAKRLKWLHIVAVPGTEISKQLKDKGVVLTRVEGVHAEPVAETALGAMLALTRKIKNAIDFQHKGRWGAKEVVEALPHASELYASRLVIIGYDYVGQSLARLCAGFGMEVTVAAPDGGDDLQFVDKFIKMNELSKFLLGADFVVCADEVKGVKLPLIGAAELQKMKKEAVIVNVAVPGMIDEKALLCALQGASIGGAALDVFEKTPLPEGHPFFSAPNMIVLPRISIFSTRYWERVFAQFADILKEMV